MIRSTIARTLLGGDSAAGEVGGAPAMQPEGGVGERAGIHPRRHFLGDRQGPVRAPPVEIGKLGEAEGRADPKPQLVSNRLDHCFRTAPRAPVLAERLHRAPAVLPLEEGAVEAGAGYFFLFFLTLKVVVLVVLLPATSVAVIVKR